MSRHNPNEPDPCDHQLTIGSDGDCLLEKGHTGKHMNADGQRWTDADSVKWTVLETFTDEDGEECAMRTTTHGSEAPNMVRVAELAAKIPGRPVIFIQGPDIFYARDIEGIYRPVGSNPAMALANAAYDQEIYLDVPLDSSTEAGILAEALKPLVSVPESEILAGLYVTTRDAKCNAQGGESFGHWLLRQYRRDDRIGDLARDLRADRKAPKKLFRPEPLIEHLENHNVRANVFETAWESWSEYLTSFKCYIPAHKQAALLAEMRSHCEAAKVELDALGHTYRHHRKLATAIRKLREHTHAVVQMCNPGDLPLPEFPQPPKTAAMTPVDHLRVGSTLKALRDAARNLYILQSMWISPTHPACACLEPLADMHGKTLIGTAMCMLDDKVFAENPKLSSRVCGGFYYGDCLSTDELQAAGIMLN